MTVQKPLIIQTEHLHERAAEWLGERSELVICGPGDPDFPSLLQRAHGLVIRTYTVVDQSLLDSAPNLKVIGRAGVGVDNIDLEACEARGVQVVHTPEANTQAVAEYVFLLLLTALRPMTAVTDAVDHAEWTRLRDEHVAEQQLSELTLGVLGCGRVGSGVTQIAHGVGMRVIFSDLKEISSEVVQGATQVEVKELLSTSDVLTIHVDGRPSNRHFMNEDRLGMLKDDVLLINTARGMVIDSSALADFLKAHPKSTALLDVHDPEPPVPSSPLIGVDNAKLYPHLASRTIKANRNMSDVVEDVIAVLEGQQPRWPVARPDR